MKLLNHTNYHFEIEKKALLLQPQRLYQLCKNVKKSSFLNQTSSLQNVNERTVLNNVDLCYIYRTHVLVLLMYRRCCSSYQMTQ